MITKILKCKNTKCEKYNKEIKRWIPDLANIIDQKCDICHKNLKEIKK